MSRSNDTAMQTMNQLNASGYSVEQAMAMVNRMIDQQAYTLAATDLFYLSAAVFLLLVSLVWLTRKPKQGAHMGSSGAH